MADTPSDPENSNSAAAGSAAAGCPPTLSVTTTMPHPAAPLSPGPGGVNTAAATTTTAALFHMPATLSPAASSNNEENANSAFTFKSSKHFALNGEKMKKFFAISQLCDVRLKCSDMTIEAHRVVLAASSDYFAAMFTGTMNESRQNEIEIRGVDPLSLKCLINFCYTGEICLTEACVESLLSGACLLQLYEVVEACSDYLLNQLHPSNCLGIRNFADAQGCQKLRRFADTFTTDHFVDVIQQNEYVLLPPDDLHRLLSSDDLNVSCETQVFQALVVWLNHDLAHRRQYVGRLLSAVRLAFVSPDYIVDQIESNACFSTDGTCQDLITKAYKFHLLPNRCRTLLTCRRRKSTAGAMYVVGGMDANKGSLAIERFDYVKNQWLLVGQMSSRRLQFGAAVLDNKIYVVGGREGLKALSSFECWDSEMGGAWTAMGQMNTPRHGLGVAVLENVIYAIGGHDGWSYLASAERWHVNAKTWSPVAEMNTPRSGAGVAVLDGRIYVIGGRDGSQCLRSAEFYSPHTNKWTVIAAMSKKRGSVGVGVLHDLIYVVGGLESPSCNGTSALTRYCCVERYDPKTDQWCFIANLSIGRDGIAVGTLGDHLFAIGGYSGQHYMQLVEIYDEESNEWTKEGNLMNGRAGACVAVIPTYEHNVPVSNPAVFNANYL